MFFCKGFCKHRGETEFQTKNSIEEISEVPESYKEAEAAIRAHAAVLL